MKDFCKPFILPQKLKEIEKVQSWLLQKTGENFSYPRNLIESEIPNGCRMNCSKAADLMAKRPKNPRKIAKLSLKVAFVTEMQANLGKSPQNLTCWNPKNNPNAAKRNKLYLMAREAEGSMSFGSD